MDAKEFVSSTIKSIGKQSFEELKEKLVGEYISFSFIEEKLITVDVFAEKICDYFEKLELKTGDQFEKMLQHYMSDWDELVKRKIPKEPQTKKGASLPPVSRTRKYYVHAMELKNSQNMTMKQAVDYSRIMMCLYMAIIETDEKEIEDFEYAAKCLSLDKIITAMRAEKSNGINPLGKKKMFDISNLYYTDTCTFIITMIMYCYIKNNEVVGEY